MIKNKQAEKVKKKLQEQVLFSVCGVGMSMWVVCVVYMVGC